MTFWTWFFVGLWVFPFAMKYVQAYADRRALG